jgi:hypothetical protein
MPRRGKPVAAVIKKPTAAAAPANENGGGGSSAWFSTAFGQQQQRQKQQPHGAGSDGGVGGSGVLTPESASHFAATLLAEVAVSLADATAEPLRLQLERFRDALLRVHPPHAGDGGDDDATGAAAAAAVAGDAIVLASLENTIDMST